MLLKLIFFCFAADESKKNTRATDLYIVLYPLSKASSKTSSLNIALSSLNQFSFVAPRAKIYKFIKEPLLVL